MKFYVCGVEIYNDGSKDSPAIYPYDNRDEAIASFHSRLGAAMKNSKVAHVWYVVMSDTAVVQASEAWTRPVEESVREANT